jgi:hypothetical protein
MVDKVQEGWHKLGRALEAFSEVIYPWDLYARLGLESRDPKAAARFERERLLHGIDAGIEEYVRRVEIGELAPGTAYPGWKEFYQKLDPELFERVRKAIEESHGSKNPADVAAAPDAVPRGDG